MSPDLSPNGDPVPVAIASPRGESAILIVLLGAVVAAGAFGRLVPSPGPATDPGASPDQQSPSPEPAVRLVSPVSGVLHIRSTEVLVRGVAKAGIRAIDVNVIVAGQPIGGANLTVGIGRRFNGLVLITPPAQRTVAVLEIRAVGSSDRLAEVSFPVDAGAVLLPKDPSGLRGRAGGVLIVDVLVYGRLRELRGLLTGADGDLIATGSRMLSGLRVVPGGPPRTVAIELEIPTEALPSRARLHLIGIDPAGIEVEHIDANVLLSGD